MTKLPQAVALSCRTTVPRISSQVTGTGRILAPSRVSKCRAGRVVLQAGELGCDVTAAIRVWPGVAVSALAAPPVMPAADPDLIQQRLAGRAEQAR